MYTNGFLRDFVHFVKKHHMVVCCKVLPIWSALEKLAGRNRINPIFVKNLYGPVIAN